MTSRPDLDALYDWIEEYFGHRIDTMYQNAADFTVGGVLYETFELQCSLDERYGFVGAGIMIGRSSGTSRFFGKDLPWSTDRESTRQSLATIDRWCRAHLPAEFLAEYDTNIAAAKP